MGYWSVFIYWSVFTVRFRSFLFFIFFPYIFVSTKSCIEFATSLVDFMFYFVSSTFSSSSSSSSTFCTQIGFLMRMNRFVAATHAYHTTNSQNADAEVFFFFLLNVQNTGVPDYRRIPFILWKDNNLCADAQLTDICWNREIRLLFLRTRAVCCVQLSTCNRYEVCRGAISSEFECMFPSIRSTRNITGLCIQT